MMLARHSLGTAHVRRHVGGRSDVGKAEVAGEDTDHGIRFAAHAQRFTNDVGIAIEQLLPAVPCEHDDVVVALGRFLRCEVAPKEGLNAENMEEVGRYGHRSDDVRMIAVGRDADTFVLEDGCVLQGLRVLLQAQVMEVIAGNGGILVAHLLHHLAHDHEPAGIAISKGLEEDGVHYAEDRGDRADAQGECENSGQGEAGRFAELADAETDVLKAWNERGHGRTSP